MAASPFTRLVDIHTGEVKPCDLFHMPTYIAISHTWADNLFPPEVPFAESRGIRLLGCLLEQEEYGKIVYCWIDTLCIDQNDEEDKQRQIPLMGQIYGAAETVAILIKDHLGLTQAKIDEISELVADAVAMSRNGSWLIHGNEWTSSEKRRRHLKEAMDVLELFTRPTWGSRVWTLQEFILAKNIVWISGDHQPLRLNEWLFQAIPDVCNHLSIEECLVPKYKKLYSHFSGMAGAHLKLLDSTRVMELLGNRIAAVPEDEVYGLMAASGVVLDDAGNVGKEMVWARWWEKAIQEGNLRWALLPPATLPSATTHSSKITRNCAMPDFSKRHLCSSNSTLDTVVPYGPVSVHHGTVSAVGRIAGRCRVSRLLGRVQLDADADHIFRDITLCLFASNDWNLALKIASAFGAGRYSLKQRMMIAQTLVFNYYRARLATMTGRQSSFRPRFRSDIQFVVWSDFMLLQSIHMPVMNEGVAFLGKITNDLISTDIVIVTDGKKPSKDLWAVDFGATNESEKSMFMILSGLRNGAHHEGQNTVSDSTVFHKEGVSTYIQVTNSLVEASKFASHLFEEPESFQEYRMGGEACPVCQSFNDTGIGSRDLQNRGADQIVQTADPGILRYTRTQMLKQNQELRKRWRHHRNSNRVRDR